MTVRTSVYMIASPRPRVGRTLVARLLADFYLTNGRETACFDLDPEAGLSQFMPAHTQRAELSAITGQMASFDRLIIDDGIPKIIDIGPSAFRPFFTVTQQIDFAREARKRGIAPVIVFVADPDPSSENTYAWLRRHIPDALLVLVRNDFLGRIEHRATAPVAPAAVIYVPALAPGLRRYIDKRPFSFADPRTGSPLDVPLDAHMELQRWLRRVFVEFRELELRVLLADLSISLQTG